MQDRQPRFVLNRDSGLPLYLQIAHEVMYQLEMGILRTGDKLPSVRELSKKLQVSFLTVDKAYRWLRSRGTVTSRHRVGWTVVVPADSSGGEDRTRIWIAKFVDELLASAVDKGFDPMTIAQVLMHRAMAMERRLPIRKFVFLECHPEYLDDYTAELRRELADLNVKIEGILTTSLTRPVKKRTENFEILRDADYVLTTLYHYKFVQRAVAPLKRQVVALSHTIDKEALYKIVSIPHEMRLGVILGPVDPAPAIVRTLEVYRNLPTGSIPFALITDDKAVTKIQTKVDVIAYTAACRDQINSHKSKNIMNIMLRFVPDDDAIEKIRTLLAMPQPAPELSPKTGTREIHPTSHPR